MKYDTVVGLEVHIQMNTATKAFCDDANTFGESPNTHVSAISLAHPGTLPVANKYHIEKAIQLGLALGCEINKTHYFDRKHYFYPDLPKGYQITQDNQPICIGGTVRIKVAGKTKTIRIHHIHMEEDAGKSIHDVHDSLSLLDLNRAGTPLLELVTEPDLCSGEEVYVFMAELQKLLKYLDVSDADMEKGSMRCDCNVSIKPVGVTQLGERCEIKNLNSKRFARDAVEYEAKRQAILLDQGISFTKQTLHYDPSTKKTSTLRDKEGVADYRYFPDPDLPPITISENQLTAIRSSMPELPSEIKVRLISQYQFSEDYADQLTQSQAAYAFFEQLTVQHEVKAVANFIINQVLPSLDPESEFSASMPLTIDQCVSYLDLLADGKVNTSMAHNQLWPELLKNSTADPLELAKKLGLIIIQDKSVVDQLIKDVLATNPKQLDQFRKGKKALLGFFIGAAMRSSGGNVDPVELKQKLIKALSKN